MAWSVSYPDVGPVHSGTAPITPGKAFGRSLSNLFTNSSKDEKQGSERVSSRLSQKLLQ